MNTILGVNLPVSYVTIAAAVILLAYLFVGIKKGLFKSLFGIVELVGGIVAAVFCAPYVTNMVMKQDFVSALGSYAPNIVGILCFLVVFLIAFFLLKIVFNFINRALSNVPILGGINRILGAVFNVAVGLLVIMVVIYFINMFSGISFFGKIVENAQTDGFSKWLFNSNWVDEILRLLANKVPAINQFLDSLHNIAAGLA